MSLKGKVAIVTGGNSGIGKAIALGLAKAGASIVIDYVAHPEATEALEREIAALGDSAIGVEADVSRVDGLANAGRCRGGEIRPPRHHGEQCRRGDTHVGAGHDGGRLRQGACHQSQKRVLRHPDRREADDRARRRRTDHQHHLGARGLADAGQHRLLPGQGRHADADPHRRRGTGAARHLRGRRRAGRGGDADQPVHHARSGAAGEAQRGHPARPHGAAGGDRQRGRCSSPAMARVT